MKFNINDRVYKKSRKPFKSKLKINTIKSFVQHPYVDKIAAKFHEDDSFVAIDRLVEISENNWEILEILKNSQKPENL